MNYGYDNIYRLTSEAVFADPSGNNGTINYTYDAVGNRTQQTSTNPAITSGGLGFDADDRLTTDSYDANGNTIGSGGLTYSYDFENHLSQQGGATFVYDGDGNRVEKIVGGVTTKYLVAEVNPTGYPQVVNESFSGGTGARELSHAYVYGLDRSIGSIERNGTKPHGEARVCIFQCGMAAIAGENARRYTRLDYRHYPDGRPRPIRIFSQNRPRVLCVMAWDFVSSARAANDFAAVLSIPGAVRPSSAGALHSSSECRIRAARSGLTKCAGGQRDQPHRRDRRSVHQATMRHARSRGGRFARRKIFPCPLFSWGIGGRSMEQGGSEIRGCYCLVRELGRFGRRSSTSN